MLQQINFFLLLMILLPLIILQCTFIDAYNYYRLPTSIRPELYKLKILTHLNDKEFQFNGISKIYVNVYDNDTKNITLHFKDLKIDEKQIRIEKITNNILSYDNDDDDNDSNSNNKIYEIRNIEKIPEYDYLIIHLNENLLKNDKLKITISFSGELNTNLNGYYRSSYIDKKTKEKRWIAITHFEPTSARQAFPCFDEPDMKAKFQIILGHDKKFTAISNTPVKLSKEVSDKPGWIWDYFEETVPMSTYLVAYSVNDFKYKESKIENMKSNNTIIFRTWARNDALSQVNYASEVGPKVLKFYEDYFNIKFPLPKIDQIAIPDFSAGAMENWGLVTYRETALLYDENRSSSSNKHRVASVISHELAHQWFGNLVTMKWWTDIWLNEGFATYIASLGVDHIHPEWDSYNEESIDNTLDIFKIDALKSSHPISVKIENANDLNQIFDSISYNKGSCVIRMMHLFLGEKTFRDGITNYLKEHEYNNAEQDDLWKSLTDVAHKYETIPESYNVKEIMDSWTLQTGYPVINIERDYNTGGVIITQSRYLLDTNTARNDYENCWWIPLSFTKESELNFNNTQPIRWLECKGKEMIPINIDYLASSDEWIIFNIQLSSLYKVKYDEKNWELLINTLNSKNYNKIHVLNRAQLIDDAMDLAWTGDQDYNIAMRLIEYLKQERDYIPWKTALSNLNAVNRMLKRTSQYDFFKKYMKRILTPIYQAVGELKPGAEPNNKNENDTGRLDAVKRRVLILGWSCRFNVGNCITGAKEYFEMWQKSENPDRINPIPVNLRSVIYCTVIREGNENEWNFLWERYKQSNVASEKQTILSALGCSREIWIIQRYLEWCFNETYGIRKQDVVLVFNSIAKDTVGFHLARDYLFNNIDTIYKYFEPESSKLGRLISPLAKQMNTQNDLKIMKDFIENNKKYFEKSSRGIQRALENIEINSQWKANNFDNFARQLQRYL